jgi:hypothetical protein
MQMVRVAGMVNGGWFHQIKIHLAAQITNPKKKLLTQVVLFILVGAQPPPKKSM